MGINLRNKTKEYWRACLFFACAVECMLFCHNHGLESKLMNLEPAIPLLAIGSGVPVICDDSAADTVCELDYSGLYNSYINKKELNDIITKYSVLEYTVINVFRLNLIWKMKPIFDVGIA